MNNPVSHEFSHLDAPDNLDLKHIPGESGWPIIGKLISIEKDVVGFHRDQIARFGQPSFLGLGFQQGVMITHPDHLQQVLLDKNQDFSSQMGYEKAVARYYGGAFIMQDFGEHKLSRRIMQGAFKNASLKGYVDIMNPAVKEHVANWDSIKDFRYGREVKSLLIDVAARVFFGIDGTDKVLLKRIERAFYKINEKGMMALVNVDLPGFKYHAGLQGKCEIEEIITDIIRLRRAKPGTDLTSILAQEVDENGELWPEEVLVPHLSMLIFAAHDTTVGATSSLMLYLADPKYHHLQEQLRATAQSFDGGPPSLDDLNEMEDYERYVLEALRMHPSAGLFTRRTIRDVTIGERLIPANTILFMMVGWAQRNPEFWTKPDEFDPERFSSERREDKVHPFAFAPFGGGAHKCIGMHFALMNAKLILQHTLRQYRFDFVPGYKPGSRVLPLPMPFGQLPLKVSRV
jgi:cytochrome P450